MKRNRIIELMVGRAMDSEFPTEDRKVGDIRLRARNLVKGNKVKGISLEVRAGEILALTGLVGAGRTETVRLLFGADIRDGGIVELDGKELDIQNPRDAINAGNLSSHGGSKRARVGPRPLGEREFRSSQSGVIFN
jgi:ABC-type sugar transport system ATPase subunit